MGEFEFLVLFAASALGADAYGAEIRRAVTSRSGREYSVGAIYTTLQRLEDKGLVTSVPTEPLPVRGGRSRRRFHLTASGRTELNRSVANRRKLWASLAPGWKAS